MIYECVICKTPINLYYNSVTKKWMRYDHCKEWLAENVTDDDKSGKVMIPKITDIE